MYGSGQEFFLGSALALNQHGEVIERESLLAYSRILFIGSEAVVKLVNMLSAYLESKNTGSGGGG